MWCRSDQERGADVERGESSGSERTISFAAAWMVGVWTGIPLSPSILLASLSMEGSFFQYTRRWSQHASWRAYVYREVQQQRAIQERINGGVAPVEGLALLRGQMHLILSNATKVAAFSV